MGVGRISWEHLKTKPDQSRLEVLFAEASQAAAKGMFLEALRLSDCARRLAPEDSVTLLVYGVLLLHLGLFSEAVDLLLDRSEPELKVVRASALCSLGRFKDASDTCYSLLTAFSLDAVEGLRSLASECVRCPANEGLSGWIGADSSLRLAGEARWDLPLCIEIGGVVISAEIVDSGPRETRSPSFYSFTANVPANVSGRLLVSSGGTNVIGSGSVWPPPFGLTGWVASDKGALTGKMLTGKIRMDWSPRSRLTLAIGPVGDPCLRQVVIEPIDFDGRTPFHISLNSAETELAELQVAAVLPDGSSFPLVGSPLRIRSRAPQPERLERATPDSAPDACFVPDRTIDIVVPVYAGLKETLLCLESILATTSRHEAEVIVVNDSSPDAELCSALARMADDGRITLLTNRANMGFPGAANKGMRLHPTRDVILLNADTELFGDWLTRMKTAADSNTAIGTVTPLGEAASIVSYIHAPGSSFSRSEAETIDRIAREVNPGKVVDLPVGVGFCLYIKRACLDDTGYFDEDTFASGYGEENDLCLRAAACGWRHVASPNLFVRHLGATSFGPMKGVLTERNSHILNALHPGYDAAVASFIASDPLLESRRAIDMYRLIRTVNRPALLITCALKGGVKRHVDLRSAHLLGLGRTVLVLEPLHADQTGRIKLTVVGNELHNLIFVLPEELALLSKLLLDLNLDMTELHHFAGLPASVLELLAKFNNGYEVYVHDYSWICPRLSLATGGGHYCGEPAIYECERCIRQHGTLLDESLTVASLRERSTQLLHGANTVTAPSRDTRNRLANYFPHLPVVVSPWEMSPLPQTRTAGNAASRVRVAVVGAISVPKGHRVLLECALDAAARNLDMDFVLIGFSCDDHALHATGRVFITGPYADNEVSALLAREQCHVALFPSVIPETWCYALSYAIAEGLPIVAFDLGAIAERLHNYQAAEVLPLFSSATKINDALLRSATKTYTPNIREVLTMQPDMSPDTPVPADPIETSVQFLPLPEGVYTFTVKGGATSRPSPDGITLPAVQVGVAPGKSEATVEFLARGGTTDRWLAQTRDMLVARITGSGASLMLTSMRTPSSPALGINIRRLDPDLFSNDPELDSAGSMASEDATVLPAQIVAHIHRIGDVPFSDGWAGCLGDRLWIEAFAVGSIGQLTPDSVEYCGITADGYQTPWLGNQVLCGSRGRAVPIVGCAIRLKPEIAELYDCTYTGQFVSGRVLGPFKNGDLCRSDLPRDPLWGLELSATHR